MTQTEPPFLFFITWSLLSIFLTSLDMRYILCGPSQCCIYAVFMLMIVLSSSSQSVFAHVAVFETIGRLKSDEGIALNAFFTCFCNSLFQELFILPSLD